MEYAYNVRTTEKGTLLTACDKDILGDTYTEDNVVLDLDETYYGGNTAPYTTVKEKWVEAVMVNAAGTHLLTQLQEDGLVNPDHVKTVDNIPFIHVYTLPT